MCILEEDESGYGLTFPEGGGRRGVSEEIWVPLTSEYIVFQTTKYCFLEYGFFIILPTPLRFQLNTTPMQSHVVTCVMLDS